MYSLFNAVTELIDGVVVTRVLCGAAETGKVLLSTVDLTGGLSDTVGDAGVEVAGQLLGKDAAERGQDGEGGLHDVVGKVSVWSEVACRFGAVSLAYIPARPNLSRRRQQQHRCLEA